MERLLNNYRIMPAYNFSNGENDVEVYLIDGNYIGTLDGRRYDFDNITDDDIDRAFEEDDFQYITDNSHWRDIY